jgi:hypothetical protein
VLTRSRGVGLPWPFLLGLIFAVQMMLHGLNPFHCRRVNANPPAADAKTIPSFQKTRTTTNLPCEIWLLIIRQATITHPDPLDTTRGVSFLESTECKLLDYRSSMRNKCNLSLVSRTWNKFSQEVLYEFVWIRRAMQARSLARTLLAQGRAQRACPSGWFIRRLHIETPTLERCAPVDLRTILDYAPQLIVYTDCRSVRRNRYDEITNPRVSPEQLFSALAHPNNVVRRLSWTNYDDVSFQLTVSPMLETMAANLEYLELSFCSPHFPSDSPLTSMKPPCPALDITLPVLRSLKVTLDNATFSILAQWSMPALANLSVVSSDFSYAGLQSGFSHFFLSHGVKLVQLELGHSTSSIEEHYLTMPPHQQVIPLAEWCPNLREFICSADAEWNWQNPDWIAPHILLPTHPQLEFIGIRDIDKRILDDASVSTSDSVADDAPFFPLLEQLSSLLHKEAFPKLRFIRDLSSKSDTMRRMRVQLGVIMFWTKVLRRCQEREVWLEDWRGVNVTMRDLRRASLSLGEGIWI